MEMMNKIKMVITYKLAINGMLNYSMIKCILNINERCNTEKKIRFKTEITVGHTNIIINSLEKEKIIERQLNGVTKEITLTEKRQIRRKYLIKNKFFWY